MTMQKNPGVGFLLAWILVNGLVWTVLLAMITQPFPYDIYLGVGMGGVLALAQWVVLNKYLGINFTWSWASLLAYGAFVHLCTSLLAGFVAPVSAARVSLLCDIWLPILCAGAGFWLQSSVLEYYVKYARLWVILNPLSYIAAMFLGTVAFHGLPLGLDHFPGVLWLFAGVVYGALTGIALMWMASRLRPLWQTDNKVFPDQEYLRVR